MAPFRGLRFTSSDRELGSLLCPPYDVIDADARAALIAANPHNAVRVVLPELPGDGTTENEAATPAAASDAGSEPAPRPAPENEYTYAAALLDRWVDDGTLAVDAEPALYVYELTDGTDAAGASTRGLLGAIELRDPADGVILPHENTMAGPVADRLALMEATQANLEPIYLVYDGGGAASDAVASAGTATARGAIATATTPDGVVHRLWAITAPSVIAAVAADLSQRRALIADGHHRYATYRQLAERRHRTDGAGPWDRGLALLVDSSTYGPQVHAIHRVVPNLSFADATRQARSLFTVAEVPDLDDALLRLDSGASGFTVVVTDGVHSAVVTEPDPDARAQAVHGSEPTALLELDVTVLHRILVERAWQLRDDEATVRYAHSVTDAVSAATSTNGIAVLLRPTPVAAVAAVAAAGARMPRKSTFFTPKPASGLVMRRFADE